MRTGSQFTQTVRQFEETGASRMHQTHRAAPTVSPADPVNPTRIDNTARDSVPES
ncbi:hypothetical protein GCM10010095_14980 [Streptomyces anthocyanicus]|uniref:Uncharacterized protein n=2 Tax=Streptomyces TaxID=1883 RepID=A0A7U9DR12_STRLI|nr:hypothetical protein SLI_3846 [Streptomyces lividans 1326]BDD73076.1 hypothetical protein JCM4020_36960 [Streptomyces coelicolor]BDE40247.1 hypothetical protein SLITK23_34920 [Streptomyces lividans]GGL30864.1 hypothetical protein GCM10010095_14980 [Streptomyces anthocyanicus]GHA31236.1 hypothetical protein GCM10010391_13690 [Streptomyces anthocyanicus]